MPRRSVHTHDAQGLLAECTSVPSVECGAHSSSVGRLLFFYSVGLRVFLWFALLSHEGLPLSPLVACRRRKMDSFHNRPSTEKIRIPRPIRSHGVENPTELEPGGDREDQEKLVSKNERHPVLLVHASSDCSQGPCKGPGLPPPTAGQRVPTGLVPASSLTADPRSPAQLGAFSS